MRILKVTTAYPIYLEKYYAKHPGQVDLSYAEQKRHYDRDAFGLADFWSHALAPLGYEVMEVSANVRPLQWAWARENGVPIDQDWLMQIPRAQAKAFQPDILYMADFSVFSRQWIEELRTACPSIRYVLCWCSAPYPDADVFKAHDLILSCIPELAEEFRSMGHRSVHLNHAFESRVLERIDLTRPQDLGFTFVGQIARGNRAHGQREEVLRALTKDRSLTIYAPAGDVTLKEELSWYARMGLYYGMKGLKAVGVPPSLLARIPSLGRAANWSGPPGRLSVPELKSHLRPSVFGLDMFQTLHDSAVTFNSHIDISPRSASNMRLYEATGVGTCLVTDWKENLSDLFEPDREVVTYRSAEECLEKVQWLLDHPAEREAIAKAGQARTLRDHTYLQRAPQFDAIVRELVAR